MKCKCGTNFVSGDKFCQACGRELPIIQEPVAKTVQESEELPAEKDGLSTTIGRNSILSNSQIHNTHTTTTVNNTTIEDDTKKSIVCAVSGKRVLYIESACCRVCNKDVSLDFYNEKTRRCDNCHQDFLQKYTVSYQSAFESGGGIDRHERAELDILAKQLQLTDQEKLSIESEVRSTKAAVQMEDDPEFSDLFEIELTIVKKDLFTKNDLSSALLRLKQLFDQVQTNDEISCMYFLLKALKSPDMYVTNYEGASYDEFWENYWLFIAYINKGDSTKAMTTFRDNLKKFPEKRDMIYLSEVVYLIIRFQLEQSDGLIEIADKKLNLIESVPGNFLTKLYKSNEKLLSCFDYGALKFVNIVPPEEPGLKQYFNFFISHLYKIPPELPKVVPAAFKSNIAPNSVPPKVEVKSTIVSQPSLPKPPILNYKGDNSGLSNSDVKNGTSIGAIPKLPELIKKPNAPIVPSVSRKIVSVPQKGNSIKSDTLNNPLAIDPTVKQVLRNIIFTLKHDKSSSKNIIPKLPELPQKPGLPQAPNLPKVDNQKNINQLNSKPKIPPIIPTMKQSKNINIPSIPPLPPMPGKK
jgi:hypothetical protein